MNGQYSICVRVIKALAHPMLESNDQLNIDQQGVSVNW